jgi:hypothetical protein
MEGAMTRLLGTCLLVACSSATPMRDAGRDAGLDAGRDAARIDTGFDGARDAWSAPDGSLTPDVVCGGPVTPGPCPVQDPEVASACGAEGRVVFDGRYCNFARGPECGTERGAFGTFEACAISCEAAGYCNEGAMTTNRDPQWPTCEYVRDAECECGIALGLRLDISSCDAFGLDDCHLVVEDRWHCSKTQDGPCESGPRVPPPEQWLLFRRASLLPFLDYLRCSRFLAP